MSAHQFKAGDPVVCINAKNNPGCFWLDGEAPVEGETYTIDALFVDGEGYLVISLRELPRRDAVYGPAGYYPRRFRPVQKRSTSIEALKALLNPSHVRIGEDA